MCKYLNLHVNLIRSKYKIGANEKMKSAKMKECKFLKSAQTSYARLYYFNYSLHEM